MANYLGNRRITDEHVWLIRESGMPTDQLAAITGITPRQVQAVRRRASMTMVPDREPTTLTVEQLIYLLRKHNYSDLIDLTTLQIDVVDRGVVVSTIAAQVTDTEEP